MKEQYSNIKFVTIAPTNTSFVSGGNKYNFELFDSLQKCKHISVTAYNPSAKYSDEFVLVDSLCLNLATDWRKFKNRCCIFHYHAYLHEKVSYVQLQNLTALLSEFNLIVVTSDFVKNQLAGFGLKEEKIVVMEPVVMDCGSGDKHLNDTFTACTVASFVEVKGIATYLRQLDSNRLTIDFTHHFIGDITINPEYYQQCVDIINGSVYLKKTIRLHPAGNREEICDLLKTSHLFISTSIFETFGIAVKEALNVGLPVLALNKGNLPNLIRCKEHLFETIEELICFLPHYFEKKIFSLKAPEVSDSKLSWKQHAEFLLSFY